MVVIAAQVAVVAKSYVYGYRWKRVSGLRATPSVVQHPGRGGMTASALPNELLGGVEDRGGVPAWVVAKVVGGIVYGVH
jgi:hypothetical protein